jgi:c-di-GMP-binding flagellar brake protein YcgR
MKSLLYKLLGFDRRKTVRFHVQDLELILFGKNIREKLQVDDLSAEGISFTYLDSGAPLDDVIDIDLQAGKAFRLGRVKTKVVKDVLVADNMTDMTSVRRYSGRFINISALQMHDLKNFLKQHGID